MSDETTYIGKHIGNYQIISEIARGSFGCVYLAQHIFLTSRQAAIKLLHATHLNSQEDSNRFLQEARFLETLKHPYILPILDVGIFETSPYLVTEYAPNGSLRDRIEQSYPQPLPLQEALTILSQVGHALSHAHQQHIIHRDLKPENILFNAQGDALLADFGIATTLVTTTNQPENNVGTPSYMAPEHFKGKVSKESDQYALGCIAYELFTGRKPFQATDFFSLGFQHLAEPPIAPSQFNPSIPTHIEQAILKAMAKQRTDRHAGIPAFIRALYIPSIMQEQVSSDAPNKTQHIPGSSNSLPRGLRLPAKGHAPHVQFPLTSFPLASGTAQLSAGDKEKRYTSLATATHNVEELPKATLALASPITKQLDYGDVEEAPTARLIAIPSIPSTSLPASQDTAFEYSPAPTDDLTKLRTEVAGGNLSDNTDDVLQSTEDTTRTIVHKESHPSSKKRWLFTAATIALVLLVVLGGILYTISIQSNQHGHATPTTADTTNGVTASLAPVTVTITPIRKDLKNTYTISGVIGTPTATQAQARLLSSTTQSQSKTVNASGTKTQAATHATGTLIIENYNSTTLDLFAGTTMPQKGNSSSIHLQLDANVAVPPWNSAKKAPGTARVSAHVVQTGSIGNLAAHAVCSYCNNSGVSWDAYNPAALTGGQAPQTYTAVQQSDLDGVTNSLQPSLLQTAQTSLQAQIRSNEQLVNSPQCTTNTTSLPAVGSKATTVTVTVTASCQTEVYDQQQAQTLAATLLKNDATASNYTLTSQITTTITGATVINTQQGAVSVFVNAEATALAQFTTAQKQTLAKLIAGKTAQEAQTLLLKQPGVSKVVITFSTNGLETLPTDAEQITIIIDTL